MHRAACWISGFSTDLAFIAAGRLRRRLHFVIIFFVSRKELLGLDVETNNPCFSRKITCGFTPYSSSYFAVNVMIFLATAYPESA